MVWSENVETGEVELKPVTEVFEREDNVLVHLTVNGETINTTALHPFYIVGKGWTEAIEINIGDKVLLQDGSAKAVDDKSVEELNNPVKVYNFTVDEFHTYFVAKSELLVHNSYKRDIKQIKSAAKEAGLEGDEVRAFGNYVEELKREVGKRNDVNFSYRKLLEIAEEVKEMLR